MGNRVKGKDKKLWKNFWVLFDLWQCQGSKIFWRAEKKWNFIFMWRTNNNCDCFITFPFLSWERILFLTDLTFLLFHIFSYLLVSLLNWSRFPIIIIGSFHDSFCSLHYSRPSQVMQWKQKLLLVSWLFLDYLGQDWRKESRLKDEIHDSSLSFKLFILPLTPFTHSLTHTHTISFLTISFSCAN